MIKRRLLTPGPVEVPPSVLAAASQQAPHHRTPEYRKTLQTIQNQLQSLFHTKQLVLMFSSSGTGGMEGALVNLTSPGDTVAVASGGAFGDRWKDLAKAYGVGVVLVDAEWGSAVDPGALDRALAGHPEVKAVFATLSETSTGVDHPVRELGAVCRNRGALFIVDAISGMGAVPLKTDEWGVDVAVVGSQKALLIPPGLAFASASERAWDRIATNSRPRFYFDFAKSRTAWQKEALPDTPFTSPTSLILQLHQALSLVLAEGLDRVWARQAWLADLTRTALREMGLRLFAKNHPSAVLTSVEVPAGVDGKLLVKSIRDQHGLSLAGGQKQLEGKIFRMGHVGHVDHLDLAAALTVVGSVLKHLGAEVHVARGIEAIAPKIAAGPPSATPASPAHAPR